MKGIDKDIVINIHTECIYAVYTLKQKVVLGYGYVDDLGPLDELNGRNSGTSKVDLCNIRQ